MKAAFAFLAGFFGYLVGDVAQHALRIEGTGPSAEGTCLCGWSEYALNMNGPKSARAQLRQKFAAHLVRKGAIIEIPSNREGGMRAIPIPECYVEPQGLRTGRKRRMGDD